MTLRVFRDFSSWSGLLTTLSGLVLVSLLAVGIRLVFMQTRSAGANARTGRSTNG
jgi:hypothetical protein